MGLPATDTSNARPVHLEPESSISTKVVLGDCTIFATLWRGIESITGYYVLYVLRRRVVRVTVGWVDLFDK